jgi:antitoxin component of MazEF toxin-antitoxin module
MSFLSALKGNTITVPNALIQKLGYTEETKLLVMAEDGKLVIENAATVVDREFGVDLAEAERTGFYTLQDIADYIKENRAEWWKEHDEFKKRHADFFSKYQGILSVEENKKYLEEYYNLMKQDDLEKESHT